MLLAGLRDDLASALQNQLPSSITVCRASTGDEALRLTRESGADLWVASDRLSEPSIEDSLRQLRQEAATRQIPVLLVAETRQAVSLVGDGEVFFTPVDRRQLLRAIGARLGFEATAQGRVQVAGAMAEIWKRLKQTSMNRLQALELALLDLACGRLTPDQARQAERDAHKLAGSVGTFGFTRASRLASVLEERLAGASRLGPESAGRLALKVAALRVELERGPIASREESLPGPTTGTGPLVLLLVSEPEMGDRICLEAEGLSLQVATRVEEALAHMQSLTPAVAALDLLALQPAEQGLSLLRALSQLEPPASVLLWGDPRDMTDRVMAIRWGVHEFISKKRGVSGLVEELGRACRTRLAARGRVLAVDDDPLVLASLESVLAPGGFEVFGLEDPLQFWQRLEETHPDLVILDLEMPLVNGLELCRVVRADARWSTLPVVFLTGSQDPEVVERVFEAGADDFVSKPIRARELRARLANRLRRSQVLRARGEIDPTTGAEGRETGVDSLESLIRLSLRQAQPLSLGLVSLDFPSEPLTQALAMLLLSHGDLLVRWDRDTFLVSAYGLGREEGCERLAQGLELFRQEQNATFRATVASCPADGTEAGGLLRALEESLRSLRANRVVAVPQAARQSSSTDDVVLVEDDEGLAEFLTQAFRTRGLETEWIPDGAEAIARLGGDNPELKSRVILLDFDLPGADGFEVLRAVGRRARVIMLSRPRDQAQVSRAIDLGAYDFVGKPFSLPVLLQRVQRALAD